MKRLLPIIVELIIHKRLLGTLQEGSKSVRVSVNGLYICLYDGLTVFLYPKVCIDTCILYPYCLIVMIAWVSNKYLAGNQEISLSMTGWPHTPVNTLPSSATIPLIIHTAWTRHYIIVSHAALVYPALDPITVGKKCELWWYLSSYSNKSILAWLIHTRLLIKVWEYYHSQFISFATYKTVSVKTM